MSDPVTTRVYLDLPSPLARSGIEALLASYGYLEFTAEASTADVVLRDEASGEASSAGADAPIALLIATPIHSAQLQTALSQGIHAFIPVHASPNQIAAALQAAAAGLIVIPPGSANVIVGAMPSTSGPPEPLTPREQEVIEMLAEGLSNKLIAARLNISDHTAKFHVNAILSKLNAGTRTEAVTKAIRAGLVKI